jgi:hypothetical protein
MKPSTASNGKLEGIRLPDFIGVGPPRTATTWLHEALKGCAGLPQGIKETNFFLWQYDKGPEWYASFFQHYAASVPIGEFSPSYFAAREARERIALDIPDCKIIVTLRDPVERLYSHYRKGYEQAHFPGTFEETLESRPDLLEWSRYAKYLRGWYDSFGRGNVLVLIHDDLKRDPQEFLRRVTQFIGIEPRSAAPVPPASDSVNAISEMPRSLYLARLARAARDRLERRGAFGMIQTLARTGLRPILFGGGRPFPQLHRETKARLQRQFEPEIDQLEQLLGYGLPQWGRSTYRGAPIRTEK